MQFVLHNPCVLVFCSVFLAVLALAIAEVQHARKNKKGKRK